MLQVVEPPNSTAYLLYTESGSKNRQGGLKDRNKVDNKVVKYLLKYLLMLKILVGVV